jgi:XTP/dITP diphosphohydrolase
MKKILIASANKKKIVEFNNILKEIKEITLLSLDDFKEIKVSDVEETGKTLQKNSLIKAKYYSSIFQIDTIADDTGLFVESLNFEPGIYSARYAGKDCNDQKNREKLLLNLKDKENRTAFFKTVITYYSFKSSKHLFFEGICHGKIIENEIGDNGFGYDPIFIPDGYDLTFAQMDKEIKDKISHRAKALIKFYSYFNK